MIFAHDAFASTGCQSAPSTHINCREALRFPSREGERTQCDIDLGDLAHSSQAIAALGQIQGIAEHEAKALVLDIGERQVRIDLRPGDWRTSGDPGWPLLPAFS
ncbi:hypothetical protein [Mesorhizobium sp. 113-3-3]|uniref:hypothetical protein n=1 Tax=Mesorhizobium sp. 113-3-3 TaxID=2744516 RepID=UPI001928DA62|nr:hypothetical protein [Mesorhizobium sp. 113-3-3]